MTHPIAFARTGWIARDQHSPMISGKAIAARPGLVPLDGADVAAARHEQGSPDWAHSTAANNADGTRSGEAHVDSYVRFAASPARGESDVDSSPIRHVSDASKPGRRVTVDPFEW